MSEFSDKIRERLTANANDFDGIVSDMLKKMEEMEFIINDQRKIIESYNDMISEVTDKEGSTAILTYIARQEHAHDLLVMGGFNGCFRQAERALRFLSRWPRPSGGSESYNAEHLDQIADEISRSLREAI